jgi:protein-disulfide isomerase
MAGSSKKPMSTPLNNAVTRHDHIKGIETAPLELVEYGDYQCPSCGESFLVMEEVLETLGNDLMFVFRNFPLTEMHPDAFNAALAAEAAANQNKFWEMYDLLFRNQANLSEDDLFAYAAHIKLDMEQFGRDMQSQALVSKIKADMESGLKSAVNGTPTFFINGEKFEGDWGDNGLLQYLEQLL